MTINWWTLGLQAVNVLILVWLLSRVFWHPVARAIAARQTASQTMLDAGQAAQADADAALAEATHARDGIAAERAAALVAATGAAEAATRAALDEARQKAERLINAARATIAREGAAARAETTARSAELAVSIARKLVSRLDTDAIQAAFLTLLVTAMDKMSPPDRAALAATAGGIDIVSPTALNAADKANITKALQQALAVGQPPDAAPELRFVSDPDLIAGCELRTAHFVLRNSWKSDLDRILKELGHAA